MMKIRQRLASVDGGTMLVVVLVALVSTILILAWFGALPEWVRKLLFAPLLPAPSHC